MPVVIVSTARLKARLSPTTYETIFDDFGVGAANDASAAAFLAESQSIAMMYLRGEYVSADKWTSAADVPDVVATLCLDLAHGRAMERFPEYVRGSGKEMIDRAIAELTKIRDGKLPIGAADNRPIEAPINARASFRTGTIDNDRPSLGFIKDGTGDGGF